MIRFLCLILFLLTCYCSPPVLQVPQEQDIISLFEKLLRQNDGRDITAFGEAEIAMQGEVQTADLELKAGSNWFKADFYGPLGLAVATIAADSVRGTALIGKRVYVFRQNQLLDSFPVLSGSRLRFAELLHVMTGRIPPLLIAPFHDGKPDSLGTLKKKIIAVWKTDSLEMRVISGGSPLQIEKVVLIYKNQLPNPEIVFGRFRNGIASEIVLRENDRNYFFIKYAKVVSEN